MSEQTTSAAPDASRDLADLESKLRTSSEKTQLQLIQELGEKGEFGLTVLAEFLRSRQDEPATGIDGTIYKRLLKANSPQVDEFVRNHFPNGVVSEVSERGIEYSALQQLLAQEDFQAADRLTIQKLCELAGPDAVQRKWLYFTEVDKIPIADLHTIDRLWRVYSDGKFGFSVQREIWLGLGKNWEKFWPKIDWKNGNNWTRYPGGFTWDLSAPRGHLPLSNQLRGVRVIEKLFNHPAWG